MGRSDLERLSKEELIELVLRLQRPPKTSRTSSKPPSTDRKEQRERSNRAEPNPVTTATAGSSAPRLMRWSSTVLTGAPAAQRF